MANSIEGKWEQVQILVPFPLRLVMKDFQSRLQENPEDSMV
jgi:hypothetical protein